MGEPTADMPPPPPRFQLRAAVWCSLAVSTVAVAALYLTGTIDALWFWRGMWLATMANVLIVLAQNSQLLRDVARWEALVAEMMTMLRAVRMAPAVRCAGCHTAAHLMGGETVTAEGEPGFALPPGWRMVNERPYCDECVSKGATT